MKNYRFIALTAAIILALCSLISCSSKDNSAPNNANGGTDNDTKSASVDVDDNNASGGIDFDLANADTSVQYQTSLDISSNFDNYVGKTASFTGRYEFQNYHFIIITDITLCCTNYFEFLYDGELPPSGTDVTLSGTFDYYSDGTGSYPCIRVDKLTVL